MAASTANRIPGSILAKAKCLCSTREWETVIPANTQDKVVARIPLPYPCHIIRIDYNIQVGGSTHTLSNIEAKVDGTAITSAYTADNTTTAAMEPTNQLAAYDQGSVFTMELDTAASNATVSEVNVVLTVLPLTGS